MKKLILFFLTCIIFLGCTFGPEPDFQAEKDAILNLEDQWTVGFMSNDADKILELYAADAVSMSSDKPTLTGIQKIRESIESMLSDTALIFKTYKYSIDVVEISASGDLAYVRGNDEITMKTKDGTVQDKGRYIDIWKKIDGKWKIITMISNKGKE